MPSPFGLTSENAAYRFAVQWKEENTFREGVYIPRRDTSSRLNTVAGGRLFPGVYHHANFLVIEQPTRFQVELKSDDGKTHLCVKGHTCSDIPDSSMFRSLAEASNFFETGSLGYSATSQPGKYEGMELRSFNWKVEPLAIEEVRSSYFENREIFPEGTVKFDCALLMREITHEWHTREPISV